MNVTYKAVPYVVCFWRSVSS